MVAGAAWTLNQYCGVNSRPQDHIHMSYINHFQLPNYKFQTNPNRGAAALANFKWWKLTQTEPTLCNGESRNTSFLFLGKHFSFFLKRIGRFCLSHQIQSGHEQNIY